MLGLGGIWLTLILFYPQEFAPAVFERVNLPDARLNVSLLRKSLLITAGLLIAFVVGVPIAEAAFVAACALLFTRRVDPDHVMKAVDTDLLFFFGALFVVSGAMESSGLTAQLFGAAQAWLSGGVWTLSAVTVLLSNLVSNVPAVLLLRPVVAQLPNPHAAWLTLAAASTLAGNLTLLGSVANLIVAEIAARRGVKLTFGDYTRPGLVITLISLTFGIAWIQIFIWK